MHHVEVDGLGKCEHCQQILHILQYAGDESMSAQWLCGCCCAVVEGASFGYDATHTKKRWIGPGSRWQDTRPTEDFTIGDLHVFVRTITPRGSSLEPYSVWRHADQ